MRILLASAPVINREIEFNLQTLLEYMKAYRGKVELIVFGESILQGFECLCWDYEKDRSVGIALEDAPVRRIRAAAKEYRLAVSFGMIERRGDHLYSVSVGWKDVSQTDEHYREGERFEKFTCNGKSFAVGLCGDLWTEGQPEEMKALQADVVLWSVWCDYSPAEWNDTVKDEYAQQAARCGRDVLLVNPFCTDPTATDCATGACVHFRNGSIVRELPSGRPGTLLIEL